jgi:hypothetical protein
MGSAADAKGKGKAAATPEPDREQKEPGARSYRPYSSTPDFMLA